MTGQPLEVAIEQLLRELTPHVLGTVARRSRDFAEAEDAVQEALLAAATQWPEDGLPENPRAWIIGVARHKAIDRLRKQGRFNERREELIRMAESGGDDGESERWRTEFLYSRAASIYGGSAEIQRNIIARRLLDLGNNR